MTQLVSQTELAKINGFSKQYANKLVKSGTIQLIDGKIDIDAANAVLASSRNPSRQLQRSGQNQNSRQSHTSNSSIQNQSISGSRSFGLGSPGSGSPGAGLPVSDLSTLLLKTRIKNEMEKGKILEAKAKTELGELVSAEEVKTSAFNKARIVRDNILNLPDRLSSTFASILDEKKIHEIFLEELRAALESLATE